VPFNHCHNLVLLFYFFVLRPLLLKFQTTGCKTENKAKMAEINQKAGQYGKYLYKTIKNPLTG